MKLLVILVVFAALGGDVAFSRRRTKYSPTRSKSVGKCWPGDGSRYTGRVSESVSGKQCLNWKFSIGIGDHNYCRNPDQSQMPWCYVRKGGRIVREICAVPMCPTLTAKALPAVADTELSCGQRSERRANKIVSGSFAAVESHPWIAAIFSRRFLCGGSLISPCWVVTAAHCLDGWSSRDIDSLSVHLGKKATNETDATKEQIFSVEDLIIHPHFDSSSYNNDIALVKIRRRDGACAVKSASVRVVCLPPLHTRIPAGFQCTVAGYGQERYLGLYSQYLKKTEVNLISHKLCQSPSYYGKHITDNMLCAGSPDWTTDSCEGDSGGPLVCEASGRMFLFGIVSWGEGCAGKNKPGVYTQVTNYNKWIAQETGLSEYTKGLMYPPK